MASAILATRRRSGGAAGLLNGEDPIEGATYFLSEFPSPAEIIEDLQLGVLLGRQVFRTQTHIHYFQIYEN